MNKLGRSKYINLFLTVYVSKKIKSFENKKNNNFCIDSIKNSFRILKLDGLGTSIHGQILKIIDPCISTLVDLQSAQNLYSQVHIVLMNTIIKK